jgi:hypothetical protein
MMKTRRLIYGTLALGTAALLAYAVPAVAHHAFGAEFDPDAPIRLEGPIVRVEWVNPHSWIHIEVTEDDGTKQVWMVEGGTPNVLLRRGLRRECLTIGSVLIVDGYQAKDHSLPRANGRDVTFTDGTKFFLGSSGTGAPEDGAERRSFADGGGRC